MTTASAPDMKRRALGKGLDSLLPRINASAPAPVIVTSPEPETGKPREIPVELIDPNPFQTRTTFDESLLEELAASIRANGVVQPVLLRPRADGRFQLIAGERRLRASKLAGKATIPAVLRQVSDEQTVEITIVENLQRADLNPIEQARGFERLSKEFNMTQEQISVRTGKDRASVANYIRLLKLPDSVQQQVEGGFLSFGHARALLALSIKGLDQARIEKAAQKIIDDSLSVRRAEEYVARILVPDHIWKPKEPKPEREVDPNVREVEEELQRALGLKVTIEDRKGRGRVIIEYAKLEDFDGLLERLAGK
jgi:ParB family transcriptional regulator, chromosome partitioning protein